MGKWLEWLSAETTPDTVTQAWRHQAKAVAEALKDGRALPEIRVFGPVLYSGERVFFDGPATYARKYGGDGSYTTTNVVALGNPSFIVGSMAASGLINGQRKARARRDATPRWRDEQRVRLVTTSHRLLVHGPRQQWLTFDYAAITEFEPVLSENMMRLHFASAPTLGLLGPPVLAAAVVVAAATNPQHWMHDPRMRPLV